LLVQRFSLVFQMTIPVRQVHLERKAYCHDTQMR
jgi:hypothetical protein